MIEAKDGTQRVVRLMDGEDLMACLEGLDLGSGVILAGIGMVRDAQLGYWNGETYEIHDVPEACELLAMQGNIGLREDGSKVVHAHLTLACRDGTVAGGHLVRATVANTVEAYVQELPGIALRRKPEPNDLVGLFPETES